MQIYLQLKDIDPSKDLEQLIDEYIEQKNFRHECGNEFDELVFMRSSKDLECNTCPRDEFVQPISKIEIK